MLPPTVCKILECVISALRSFLHLCIFQVGKGPQASEVSGIVKIGQTMTMVIGVKDDENKFDMMVSTINAVNLGYNI